MDGNFNVYYANLGKLSNTFNKGYNDLLTDSISVDTLWNTIMDIRTQVREGRNFIDNDKNWRI